MLTYLEVLDLEFYINFIYFPVLLYFFNCFYFCLNQVKVDNIHCLILIMFVFMYVISITLTANIIGIRMIMIFNSHCSDNDNCTYDITARVLFKVHFYS